MTILGVAFNKGHSQVHIIDWNSSKNVRLKNDSMSKQSKAKKKSI